MHTQCFVLYTTIIQNHVHLQLVRHMYNVTYTPSAMVVRGGLLFNEENHTCYGSFLLTYLTLA